MTFPDAVASCEYLRHLYREGLGALGSNRSRVTIDDPRKISGSVNIEEAQRQIDARHHAWDFGIGVRRGENDLVVWVEVHSADSLHIQTVLSKLESLASFLRQYADDLNRMPRRLVWLATKGVYIAPGGQERRRLNQHGLLLKSKRLDLSSI